MGLEPTTSEATTRCCHQLSYAHHTDVRYILAQPVLCKQKVRRLPPPADNACTQLLGL